MVSYWISAEHLGCREPGDSSPARATKYPTETHLRSLGSRLRQMVSLDLCFTLCVCFNASCVLLRAQILHLLSISVSDKRNLFKDKDINGT